MEAEFLTTTTPLLSKFLTQLDQRTEQLMKVLNKGGSAGRKIRIIMAPMTQVCFAVGRKYYGIIS